MLNNEKTLDKIMMLIQRADPTFALPVRLRSFLSKELTSQTLYQENTILHHQDAKVGLAYYVVTGFVQIYYYDEFGDKHTTRFYPEDTIVAMNSFMDEKESPFYIEVCTGSVLTSISLENMKYIYANMKGMQELSRKVSSFFEGKELMRDRLLNRPAEERTALFYRRYPRLKPPTMFVRDVSVASFLRLHPSSLRNCRAALRL